MIGYRSSGSVVRRPRPQLSRKHHQERAGDCNERMKGNSGGLSVKIAVDPDNGADHGSREQAQEWFGEIVHGAV